MAIFPHKLFNNQSNKRARIYLHVKSKHTKKPPQQSSQKTEATKVNAKIDSLDDSDGNRRNKNINHFAPLFESYYDEGTKPITKPNMNTFIVISED